jgi:hypothetical protein
VNSVFEVQDASRIYHILFGVQVVPQEEIALLKDQLSKEASCGKAHWIAAVDLF